MGGGISGDNMAGGGPFNSVLSDDEHDRGRQHVGRRRAGLRADQQQGRELLAQRRRRYDVRLHRHRQQAVGRRRARRRWPNNGGPHRHSAAHPGQPRARRGRSGGLPGHRPAWRHPARSSAAATWARPSWLRRRRPPARRAAMTTSAATLSGTVTNPCVVAGTVTFQYGTTTGLRSARWPDRTRARRQPSAPARPPTMSGLTAEHRLPLPDRGGDIRRDRQRRRRVVHDGGQRRPHRLPPAPPPPAPAALPVATLTSRALRAGDARCPDSRATCKVDGDRC